ncbi:hypothetical protein H4W81_006762 [Nonomuraea africana]|uniref:Aldehyde dehydrogenase family protein n=1 Tax=Nonomuraea africana TaxID=46171 RepID=A0ABR9KQV6_9ACTN|nr:hypothetical protein [Nonomuraea africana]
MREYTKLYIDGAWREPEQGTVLELTGRGAAGSPQCWCGG